MTTIANAHVLNFERNESGVPTCPFDHHEEAFGANFKDYLDEMRAAGPLVWSTLYGGFWVATTHEMARRLAIDSDTFQVGRTATRTGGIFIPPPPGADTRPRFVPGEADGVEHDRYRLALNPHFSKQRIAELSSLVERHVREAIDRVIAMGRFDVSRDLVAPILAGIACEHMGIEVADPPKFFDSLGHLVTHGASDDHDAAQKNFDEAWANIVEIVAKRRSDPHNDVISALVQWTDPVFTDDEVYMMVLNVSLGANDTTKSLIAQALVYLDGHQDIQQLLRVDTAKVRPAIDEFLRLLPVTMGAARTADRDVEVDGITIKEGDRVYLSWPGGNFDPAKYADPRSFDLTRGSAQQLGMGVGAHFCLGAWLAKSISAVTIRELLARTKYRIDRENLRENPNRAVLCLYDDCPAIVEEAR